jgi:gluconolactonase
MHDLIAPDAELEQLATGFLFVEGPVWDPWHGCLYFSDIPDDTLYRYTDADGTDVYRRPSHYSNGLTLDDQGRLIACEHGARRVTRGHGDEVEVLAERYQGKRLNSPNDVVVARDGSILFTDPPYGLREGQGGPAERELDFCGVYRLAPGSDEPILLVDDFETPNGLALNGDESRLFIDDTVRGHIRVFDVEENWQLSGGGVFAELSDDAPGVPDGMKLDVEDNVYCTGPGGVWVYSPAGDLLGRINMPEITANLNWGDEEGRSLYLTATTSLYRIRCRTRGRLPGE